MAISTKHYAFIQLFLDILPASGIPLTGNTEILSRRILVMKFKRFIAAIISAAFTLAALIIYCHLADLFPPLIDSLYKILLPITVCALVFLHGLLCTPCTRSLRSLVHSRMLYQLSYRGITC